MLRITDIKLYLANRVIIEKLYFMHIMQYYATLSSMWCT